MYLTNSDKYAIILSLNIGNPGGDFLTGAANARSVLETELSPSVRLQIVPVIMRAYSLTDTLFEDSDFLRWAVGKDLYRQVRRVVVEHELKRLVDTRELGFKAVIAPNAIDNCRHLELRGKRLVLTVSQTTSPRALPRKALYRNHHSWSNQQCLVFPGHNDEDANVDEDRRLYAILTHGYLNKQPEHIAIGVPEPLVKGWIVRLNLLAGPLPVARPEGMGTLEEEQLVSLKDHVKKVVEEHA